MQAASVRRCCACAAGLFFGLVSGTALIGIRMMFDIVRSAGINALEIVVLVLFAVTFSWISISFWNAVIGSH